jgi:hypothetical protein
MQKRRWVKKGSLMAVLAIAGFAPAAAQMPQGTSRSTWSRMEGTVRLEEARMYPPYMVIETTGYPRMYDRVVTVETQVPNSGYDLIIDEVRAVGDELWVIANLRQTEGVYSQAPTTLSDRIIIHGPDNMQVRTVIVGDVSMSTAGDTQRYATRADLEASTDVDKGFVLYKRFG